MKIKMHEISIRDIFKGYCDSQDNGVVALSGCLDVRPPFQREFIYRDEQRDEVIRTVRKGFPLNVFYWSVSGKNAEGQYMYELMDGQQRTLSICQYLAGEFSIDSFGFSNLTQEEQDQILEYKLSVYICDGNEREKLEWFKVINISGEKLSNQELRNAVYVGPWLADARKKFSKPTCVAYKLASDYINGEPKGQAYLETVLLWAADKHGMSIEDYMAKHQHDDDAEELWEYFQSVIRWVETVFPHEAGCKPRKEMKGIAWGMLYNRYSATVKSSLEPHVVKLMADDDVTSKKGIYEYLLTGKEKKLSIRDFRPNEKRTAYEKQKGLCARCHKHFDFCEMHADHIIPWAKGGKTIPENCQMLCRDCNLDKSDK